MGGETMAVLEVIATCVDDVLQAVQGGAGRIELLSGLSEGGLTPSGALVRAAVHAAGDVPVMVMIRPHAMSFCYSRPDVEVMMDDVAAAQDCGAYGVVFGALTAEGAVDLKTMDRLMRHIGPLEVTFHRAVDATPDPVEALRKIREYPAVRRVLTSGGRGNIADNIPRLAEMNEAAGPALRIMAGGGVTLGNIERIAAAGVAKEYHVGKMVREDRSYLGRVMPEVVRQFAEIVKAL